MDDQLDMFDGDVGSLTMPQRVERMDYLLKDSYDILDRAIEKHVGDKDIAGICALFSGGNDSTTLAHMFQQSGDLTHAIHANTTIGIEKTREFVRETCRQWGLPLLEIKPPRMEDRYRALILDRGFPGPAQHWKMYTRLKERSLQEARRQLVKNPRRERVIYIAGRRRSESARRAYVPEAERNGSIVFVSPLVNWTKVDLNTYRIVMAENGYPVPRNEVSDILHMSGECLCGAFAHPGELDEIAEWFPAVVAEIRELEAEIADRDDIPDYAKTWGWGADPELKEKSRPSKTGLMCSSCDARFVQEVLA